MKTRKVCALTLLFAGAMNAGSIWNYTFTDYFCKECAAVGFSFSLPAPLELAPNQDFWIPGSQLTSCDTVNPAMYCYGAELYWRSPGVLQVNFSRQFSYPADWELPTEAQFQIPGLNVEGVYTNQLGYSGIVETQVFSIIDPPPADTPEPSALWLLLSGLVLIGIRNWRGRINLSSRRLELAGPARRP
ncbi:MAG TPA: PEP-CTERM sorting domain-containing protein [Bryobacteraceae bacterium]